MTSFCNAWHADRTGERYFHITVPLYFAVVAFIIAAATTTTGPRYFAMMIMVPGIYTGYGVALGWISNTLPRPPAKRAAALAAINAVANTSSIYASYMYPSSAGPRYGKLGLRAYCSRLSRTDTVGSCGYECQLRNSFHCNMLCNFAEVHFGEIEQEARAWRGCRWSNFCWRRSTWRSFEERIPIHSVSTRRGTVP